MNPIRIVIDLRPLQNAASAPATAAYLGNLLRAFAANPVDGETFVPLLQAGLADPTETIPGLPLARRRLLPPTNALRSAALVTDPFLLRAAQTLAGRNAVYHVAGADLPLASGIPVVATLLDLAAWELPGAFQMSPTAAFGQRLRARILRDADAVIVGSRLVARQAGRLLHLRADRVHVVPFAAMEWDSTLADEGPGPGDASAGLTRGTDGAAADRPAGGPTSEAGAPAADAPASGAPEAAAATPGPPATATTAASRYLVFFARHDARSDARTLFDTLALLRDRARPTTLDPAAAWPPPLILVGANPGDRAEIARSAARRGVEDLIGYAPYGSPAERAALLRGARAAVIPALADAAGFSAIDALATGTPVVASGVGALPEIVAGAGVIVPPGDPERMARALTTIYSDEDFHARLARSAAASPYALRSWSEVAAATRAIYAAAVSASAR